MDWLISDCSGWEILPWCAAERGGSKASTWTDDIVSGALCQYVNFQIKNNNSRLQFRSLWHRLFDGFTEDWTIVNNFQEFAQHV